MKKRLLLIILLTILVVSCFALVGCEESSEGIQYTLSDDGKSYIVVGIGSCEDVDITIPAKYKGKKVTAIADEAFAESAIHSIIIPESVTSIGNKAFYNCESLVNVTFPLELTQIGDYAFSKCKKLDCLNFGKDSKLTTIGNSAFAYCKFVNPYVVIPSNVTNLGENIFEGSNVFSISFGEDSKLTTIGDYTFSGSRLDEITIPASVTSIGVRAFSNSLCKIVFEQNTQLTTIGEEAFYASGLKSIEIPSTVTNIGKAAFDKCSNLEKVEITDLPAWCNIDFASTSSNPLFFARHLYLNGEELTNLVIPDGLTSIHAYSFANCDSLVNVTIPSGITSIEDFAFDFCQNLTSVNIPATVTSIGYRAFMSCYALENLVFEENSQLETIAEKAFYICHSLDSVTIPASVTSIGKLAFGIHYNVENSGLKRIVFEKGSKLTNIDEYAFDSCYALERVEISDLLFWCNIKFANDRSNPLYYAKHLYINGEEVQNLVIPEEIKRLNSYAFINCDSIVRVDVHSNFNTMSDHAFVGCTNLESITFDELSRLEGIGNKAFYGCSSLISITIPKGANYIGVEAFAGCESLISVTFEDPDGWYIGNDRWDQDGASIDLTNPSRNVTYLTDTYASKYLLADPWQKEWWNYPTAN